jgi:hypothetical protein
MSGSPVAIVRSQSAKFVEPTIECRKIRRELEQQFADEVAV